jgi:multidrug efflux pump subunit AcrA (membrane-fusion protein)
MSNELPLSPDSPPSAGDVALRGHRAAYPGRRRHLVILGGAAALLLGGVLLMARAEAKVNHVPLDAAPKPVSFVVTTPATYRAHKTYVGALRPWVSADVGPQFLSAYVDTVLVRPGAAVRRGEVIASLDCRNATALSRAAALEARSVDARQKAIADEANRTTRLQEGGFASVNETEQAQAQSTSVMAQLDAQKAQLAHSSLEVGDCLLRAPFDGEIGDRYIDPGAFVRPGMAIASVVDRTTARFVADVPENDFAVVTPGTQVAIRADAVRLDVAGPIARRAPHADPETRTVHFAYGDSVPVVAIPSYGATVRGSKATLFVLDGDLARARTFAVVGEEGGQLLLEASLGAGAKVVTAGRTVLVDGDRVVGRLEAQLPGKGAP